MSLKITALSVAALLAAIALRWLLDPLMGDSLPLVTLFGAVAIAVWIGGSRPAIAVTLLGYVACAYLFIPPRGELGLGDPINRVGLAAYLLTCAIIVGFGHAARTAQRRANKNREMLRITLRSIGDAVITTDLEGRVTYLNDVAAALTGWGLAEAQGQGLDRVFQISNEDTHAPVPNPATRALREGAVVGIANHTLLTDKAGNQRPIDDSAAPIRDEDGNVSGCVLIFRDVTQQRQIERERTRQLLAARMLASIVQSSEDAIISKSLEGVIESWNAAAERLFGYPAADAVGRHITLVIPENRIVEEDHIMASMRAGRRIEHFETERVRRDGTRIHVSLTISPIKDEAGAIVGASTIVRDVTARKRAEAERDKFVTLIENSTDFIGMFDLDGMPFFFNRAGLQLVGLQGMGQARRTHLSEFFFPEDRARVMHEFIPAVLERGHGEIEVRFRHFRTGEARWMAYKLVVLTDAGERPSGLATVSQDITERRHLEDDLRKLAADLSEADRRKNEFLATLAHELRNPLAPVANMLEVLKRSDGDAATLHRARETIERQLRQLVRLVDDLLDLNRVTHNRLELRIVEAGLATIIQHAVEASQPLADAAGHRLQLKLPTEPVVLRADPQRLAQVFGNLLNNAYKYTPRGGTVWLTAERSGEEVVVSVKDTGVGIAADKLDSVFEMFTQLRASLLPSQGGLGIGLTLVRQLVEMHGGTIQARSAGPGKGAEFLVRLPVVTESTAAPPEQPQSAAAQPSPQCRVLVVDDNEDAAVSLTMLLQLLGHETHLAHDGPEALAAIERHRPEVVLLDIGLPGMSGHEVCRRVRAQPWGKRIVLIALTGWGQEDDRRRSQEAGFDGHLVKPVDHDALARIFLSTTGQSA